jgi:hypothetical protein
MRRAVAILKYVPAVLCGLLFVAWVVSCFSLVIAQFNLPQWRGYQRKAMVFLVAGTVGVHLEPDGVDSVGIFSLRNDNSITIKDALGHLGYTRVRGTYEHSEIASPILFLLTLLLPVAGGSFTRFRFPLWSYFAWTALIAAELVYYLR